MPSNTRGARYLSPTELSKLHCFRSSLSPRDVDILDMRSKGRSGKDIEAAMGLTKTGLNSCMFRIRRKAKAAGITVPKMDYRR